MSRAGINWKTWVGLGVLVLGGLAAAALAGPPHGPACTDLSAAAPETRPGFSSLAPRSVPACIRIALR